MVGAIAELSHTEANIERIKTEDGLVPLIRLINTNGPELLVNVSRALGECANNKDALERMRRQDGVRLLWSLLKHSSEQVQVCIMAGSCVLILERPVILSCPVARIHARQLHKNNKRTHFKSCSPDPAANQFQNYESDFFYLFLFFRQRQI